MASTSKDPDPLDALKVAIQHTYSCDAMHSKTIPVHESYQGQTVWRGDVEIFMLEGCPGRKVCFAWIHHVPGEPARFFTILENNYVRSAEMAVRSAIFFGLKPHEFGAMPRL